MSKLCAKYRCERSYNGYTLDVMKSALQKYIRRCDPVKAIYAAAEMDLFAFSKDEDDKPNGEGIRSNFIHRLMVIFMEDVFSLGLWSEIDTLIFQLLSLREQRTGGKKGKNKKDDILSPAFCAIKRNEMDTICKIVYLLSMSSHSRENSFYKFCFSTFFSLDENMKRRMKRKFGWFQQLEEEKNRVYEPTRPINQVIKGLGKEITDLSNQFISALERRSAFSIYYGHLLYAIKKLPVKIGGRSKSTFLIFALIRHVVNGFKDDDKKGYLDLLDIAKRWYVELSPIKEEFLTWQTILIAITKGMNPQPVKPVENAHIKDLSGLYKRNILRHPITLDDWVFDMHTKIGKTRGKNSAHFATVSSIVYNERADIVQRYKKAYTRWKIFQSSTEEHDDDEDDEDDDDEDDEDDDDEDEDDDDEDEDEEEEEEEDDEEDEEEDEEDEEDEDLFEKHSDLETDYARFIVRAQLLCGDTKTDTYFGEKNGKVIFIKGPFSQSVEEMQRVMDMQEIKHRVGLPTIKYRVVMLQPNRDMMDMVKSFDDPTKKKVIEERQDGKGLKKGLGFRKSCNRDELYPFLVSEVLFSNDTIPIIKKGSKTAWPSDTQIIDLDRVEGMTHTRFEDVFKGRDDDMKRMYVENVMFRYIAGMPDLATRNFVMKDQSVYSIDEDSIDKDFNLEAAFSKKGEFNIFVAELRKHKEHYKKVLFRYIQFMPVKKIQKKLQLSDRAGDRYLFLYNLMR